MILSFPALLPRTLTEADKGRKVICHREFCTIFVRFKGPGGEGCEPSDISFSFPTPKE